MNGIINVYKERGFTSHDVVAKLRGILKQKKIGHTGTLDPDAEGVLPVCLGKATRLCGMLTDETKAYEAVMLLGVTTDTQDISGTVLERVEVSCTEEEAAACAASFAGEQEQIPPMYSALKQNGRRLYELAREGKVVERKPRKVVFHEIIVKEISLPRVRISVVCSKGTYIRTLCHDIGRKLGCGACMESLLRTRVGVFRLADAVRLQEIEDARDSGSLGGLITPADALFSGLPPVMTGEEHDALLHNGNPLPAASVAAYLQSAPDAPLPETIRVYDSRSRFIGIFRHEEQRGRYKVQTFFYDPKPENYL